MNRLNFDIDTFLKLYWQKQPTVLRQGIAGFVDPLTPDELAGLALEEQVESRLISCHQGSWQVRFGPFEDYHDQGERDWSLLVQAVNHWHPGAADLLSRFRFLPDWRIDDLMVSFSTPGGGVGPHVDQYDVFIIQGRGRRRWRVGAAGPQQKVVPHPSLLQVASFEPLIDVQLEPGDILYIPPGYPHDGVALESSMNYSVGFRAPDQTELLSAFADFWLAASLPSQRFTDPGRRQSALSGRIGDADQAQLIELLATCTADHRLMTQFLGRHLSEAKHELDLSPVSPPYQEQDILTLLQQGHALARQEGVRCCYFNSQPEQIYVDGDAAALPPPLVRLLADQHHLKHTELLPFIIKGPFPATLLDWINRGYWYFS